MALHLTGSVDLKDEEPFLQVAALSSPQAATVERHQDNDLDALAVRLDAHSRSLRADLLDFVLQLKERQLQQRCQAVDQQRAEGEAVLATRQHELTQALEQLTAQRQRGRHLTAALECAVYRLHKRNQLRKQFSLLARAWRAWYIHTRRERRIKVNMVVAAKHHKCSLVRAWRWQSHREAMERVRVAWAYQLVSEVQRSGTGMQHSTECVSMCYFAAEAGA